MKSNLRDYVSMSHKAGEVGELQNKYINRKNKNNLEWRVHCIFLVQYISRQSTGFARTLIGLKVKKNKKNI